MNLSILDVIVNISALSLILTRPNIRGAEAGFILAFASNISNSIMRVLGSIRTIELKGISLERTAEYRMLEHEDGQPFETNSQWEAEQEDVASAASLQGWPSKGALEVTSLRASYGMDLPDILQDVSFSVEGGQRVGIVGATGGGKSTLAKAFFSFVDITNGKIEIDGKGESI